MKPAPHRPRPRAARPHLRLLSALLALVFAGAADRAWAQPGPPPDRGPHGAGQHGPPAQPGLAGHHGQDDSHAQDMELFHYLMDHGSEIRRTITNLPNGVDTRTESDNAEVAARIQMHVLSMSARVKEARPIHMRDPLFREIFANAGKIAMTHENTPAGVRVVETSEDPYVARLIQAHAEVVSLFIKNGRREAMTNHEVPSR